MEIKRLEKEAYAGRRFTVRYTTGGYYDICACDGGFRMDYVTLAAPAEKSFDDVFFGDWLEEPTAFGAFEDGRLIGFVEGSAESWNNRFRISNICVFEREKRHGGIGGALMSSHKRRCVSGRGCSFWKPSPATKPPSHFTERTGFRSSALICMHIPIPIPNGMRCVWKWVRSSARTIRRQGDENGNIATFRTGGRSPSVQCITQKRATVTACAVPWLCFLGLCVFDASALRYALQESQWSQSSQFGKSLGS